MAMNIAMRLLICLGTIFLAGCAGNSQPTAQPKLQTIQHDGQTIYLYR